MNENCSPQTQSWPVDGLEELLQCPICEHSNARLLHENLKDEIFQCAPGIWSIWSCQYCKTAFLNPRPTIATIGMAYTSYLTHRESLDDDPAAKGVLLQSLKNIVLRKYINIKYGKSKFRMLDLFGYLVFLRPRLRVAFDAAMRNLPKTKNKDRLLDIGCGSGRFMAWARVAGWHCSGTEVDLKSAAIAVERGFDVHLGPLDELLARPDRFDVITISHVIEHVHYPLNLLKIAKKLLRDDGVLWIETPNINSHGHDLFEADWYALDPPRHLQVFNHLSLMGLIRSAGFQYIDVGDWQLDWEANVPGSIELRQKRGGRPIVSRILKSAEKVGRNHYLKREFITLTARGCNPDGR